MNAKKIVIAVFTLVMIVGGFFFYRHIGNAQNDNTQQEKIKSVKVAEVVGGGENTTIRRGVVRGVTEVHLAPKAQGRVTHVYKEIGDKVYKGQLLATIDGSELWAQTHVAQTGYESAKDATKKTENYFDEQVSQAKKARDLAKDAYEAAKQSGDDEAIAKAKANYEMAKKSVDVAKEGRDLQTEIAKGQRDVAQSQLNAAQTVARNTSLYAPFSGVIAQVNVETGSLVSSQMPMFLLVGNDGREVEVSVSREMLQNLSVGQEVEIIGDNSKKGTGKISAISPMVDTHTRKSLVKISLGNNDNFALGEYVSVVLPQKIDKGASVVVPQDAIVNIYHDTFVFVADSDIAKQRKVTIGESFDDKVTVEEGLSAGEYVVVEGQQYLNDGDSIRIMQ